MKSTTLHWYFLFPKGGFAESSVLGVAVDASTVAVSKILSKMLKDSLVDHQRKRLSEQ